MSLGFQNAGFQIVAAYDNWQPAIDIYQRNFQHPIFKKDLSTEDVVSELKGYSPDMIIGGLPAKTSPLQERGSLEVNAQTLR